MKKSIEKNGVPTRLDIIRSAKNKYISTIYKIFSVSMVLLFLIVSVVGMTYKPLSQIKESKLNQSVGIDGMNFYISSKYLNAAQDKLYFRLRTDENSVKKSSKFNLKIQPLFRDANSLEVQFDLYKADSTYYEIVLSHIPSTWSAVKLVISDTNKKGEAEFIFNRIPLHESYNLLSDDAKFSTGYASIRKVQLEIEAQQKQLNEVFPANIAELNSDIEGLKSRYAELETSLKFQIESEQVNTKIEMEGVQTAILSKQNQLEKVNQSIQMTQQKIQLLNQKMNEIAEKFKIKIEDSELQNKSS